MAVSDDVTEIVRILNDAHLVCLRAKCSRRSISAASVYGVGLWKMSTQPSHGRPLRRRSNFNRSRISSTSVSLDDRASAHMARTSREHVSAGRPQWVRGGCALAIEARRAETREAAPFTRARPAPRAATPVRPLKRTSRVSSRRSAVPWAPSTRGEGFEQEERDSAARGWRCR